MDNPTFYHILPSGIRIVHRWTDSEVCYIGIMIGAGTRDEDARVSGMAHYIEHCVFKGAYTPDGKHLSARDIIRQVEDVGGEINAYTTKEETTYYAAVPKAYVRRGMQVITNMVFRPTFEKKETDKEVQVIWDEIESYNDSPSELIYDDFESLIFQGNPLAQPILGTKKSLKHISSSPKIATQWRNENYREDRMVIFCQGNIDAKAFVHIVEKALLHRDGITHDAPLPRLCPQVSAGQELSYKKHTHQTHVMMGGGCYELGHDKQLAMYLINNILGGGSLSSRLNLSLREQYGLVYTVESQYTPLSDCGYWNIYFACEPEHKQECIDRCMSELRQLCAKPLSANQFKHALQQIHGQMAISAENRENNALAMAKQMLYFGCAPTWKQTYEKLQNLTPDMLWEVANQVYQPDQINLLTYE